MNDPDLIGYVIGGGLREGLHIRLTVTADKVQEGSFVVCEGDRYRYYGLVTDLQLGATDPRFADEESGRLQTALARELLGTTMFTTLAMYPTLIMDKGPELGTPEQGQWQDRVDRGEENPGPKPVKTVPAHRTEVRLADEADVAEIFGKERVLGCVTGWGATLHSPLELEMTSTGEFVIGNLANQPDSRLDVVKEILSLVVPCEISGNIRGSLYSKLIINSCITSVGGICGLYVGEMLKRKQVRTIFFKIMEEAMDVARAMGIQCVYFTGINDRESLGLFQHRVAIRQSGKHLQVGGKPYNRLEIIEQNVEDRD